MQILHLKTQDDQPYGSVRLCCERCGTMLAGQHGEPAWTDDRKLWGSPPDGYVNCSTDHDNRRLVESVMDR